jgi:predicted nucleic acid-binding protein
MLTATVTRRAFFCRATQQSVLRLLSTETLANTYGVPPITNHEALNIFDRFMATPTIGFIDEPANIAPLWRTFADLPTPSPKRWMDAYLAAFAVEAELDFVTFDSAFKVFPGLNPTVLVAAPPASSRP